MFARTHAHSAPPRRPFLGVVIFTLRIDVIPTHHPFDRAGPCRRGLSDQRFQPASRRGSHASPAIPSRRKPKSLPLSLIGGALFGLCGCLADMTRHSAVEVGPSTEPSVELGTPILANQYDLPSHPRPLRRGDASVTMGSCDRNRRYSSRECIHPPVSSD